MAAATNDAPNLCQFSLIHYQLSPAKERAFSQIAADLLRRHEETFGFKASTNFHFKIRLFGRRQEFQNFAATNATPFEAGMGGYFSLADHEVNLWLPEEPSYLAQLVLHECSHAIARDRFPNLPPWFNEGCAEYFSIPRNMEGSTQTWFFKVRWGKLNQWLKEDSLPKLEIFLNLGWNDFYQGDLERNYAVSWSLFQFLMCNSANQKLMNDLARSFQNREAKHPDCSIVLGQLYSGGLKQFEADWHEWIRSVVKKPFAPAPFTR